MVAEFTTGEKYLSFTAELDNEKDCACSGLNLTGVISTLLDFSPRSMAELLVTESLMITFTGGSEETFVFLFVGILDITEMQQKQMQLSGLRHHR